MPDHRGAMRRTVTRLARLGKLHGVVYGLAVPVLVALWTGLHADLTAVHWAAFWVPLVLAIGLSGSTAWLLNDALLKPEVYLEIEEERKSSADLEDQVRFLSDVQEYSLSAFSISVNAAVSADRQPRHLQETIEEICETALENSEGFSALGLANAGA